MNRFLKAKATASAFAVASMVAGLAACGGGGDGQSSAFVIPAAPAVTPEVTAPPLYYASTIVTTAPVTPSYAAASEELAAFNLLNGERNNCGFGSVSQNTQLDTAARGHAQWQLRNNYGGHYQDADVPLGFTGVKPIDRTKAAGYPQDNAAAIQDEIHTAVGTSNKTGYGVGGIRGLLGAPYHLMGLVGSSREIGLSVFSAGVSGADITTPGNWHARVILQADLGYQSTSTAQLVASDAVLTYPCQGTVGTSYQLTNETPNPIPGRDLKLNPIGQSIYVHVRDGNTLTISAVSMIQVSSGAPVALREPMTSANDPNHGLGSHQAFVIPDAPLLPNTAYQVSINGTNNAGAFSRTFAFSTGAT